MSKAAERDRPDLRQGRRGGRRQVRHGAEALPESPHGQARGTEPT
jgi:hypothetical protein